MGKRALLAQPHFPVVATAGCQQPSNNDLLLVDAVLLVVLLLWSAFGHSPPSALLFETTSPRGSFTLLLP